MLTGLDSRREFIKKSVYVVPTILSLQVALVEARASSLPLDPDIYGRRGERPPLGERAQRDTRDTRDLSR